MSPRAATVPATSPMASDADFMIELGDSTVIKLMKSHDVFDERQKKIEEDTFLREVKAGLIAEKLGKE